MDIILAAQFFVTLLIVIILCYALIQMLDKHKLKRLFSEEYIKVIQSRNVRQLYPLIPRQSSIKYCKTKKFLASVGWRISVEEIYLCKWLLFAITMFILVTIYSTNAAMKLKEVVQDVNYNHNMIDTLKIDTPQLVASEVELFQFIDRNITNGNDLYNKENKKMYIEYIENLLIQHNHSADESLRETAERLYLKVLQTRMIKNDIAPYVYIVLFSCLLYYAPDLLGQIKKKLIEDKKNWEILNCMIVFSIFGRMSPFSVRMILEHMLIVTEVYKPVIEMLIEGLKKGGKQEESFDAVLAIVDRDELYELIETLKLTRRTGLVNSVDDIDVIIDHTIKWIEIENISRRRNKMLYAMTAVAFVMGLGCIYFAYGLTIISNPANMFMK